MEAVIRVDNRCRETLRVDAPSIVHGIFRSVLRTDLYGIGKVVLVDRIIPTDSKKRDTVVLGLYHCRFQGRPAWIELAMVPILQDPWWGEWIIPYILELRVAEVLLHEVGHHQHVLRPNGVQKGQHETFADRYMKRAMNRYLDSLSPALLIWAYVVCGIIGALFELRRFCRKAWRQAL